jgi:hypothetical protein
MKRYLLFAGAQYYPCGGWDDLEGDFDTLEEAREAAKHSPIKLAPEYDWTQIVDTQIGEEIQQ